MQQLSAECHARHVRDQTSHPRLPRTSDATHGLALHDRVDAAISRSQTVTASSTSLRRASRSLMRRALALTRTSGDLRILSGGYESGSIARPIRRRLAASTEHQSTDYSATSPAKSADGCWAHAEVYQHRTVIGSAPQGTGTVDDGPAECWDVRELDSRDVPGARSDRCLVFENHQRVRRVWNYPGEWTTLPAAELLALAGLA